MILLVLTACRDVLPPEGMEVRDVHALQAVGDLDRDGLTDLLVTIRSEGTADSYGNYYAYDLHLFTEGIPLAETWEDVSEDRDRTAMVSLPSLRDHEAWVLGPGDIDGDRHDDLVIGSCGRSEFGGACIEHMAIVWGRQSWSDSEDTPVDVETDDAALPRPYALGDLDGDGLTDLLGGPPLESPVKLLLGTDDRWGDGLGIEDLIQWSGETTGLRPIGDVDGDGLGDVVSQGEGCELYWNGGVEGFGAIEATSDAAEVILPDPGWGRVIGGPAGDLDGDGIDDWWLQPDGTGSGCTEPDPDLGLVLIQGRSRGPDVLYASAWVRGGGDGVEFVVSGGDLDGDGHADLALLYNSSADERGGWEIVSGSDVAFGSPGHLLGPTTWEDTYVTGAWWLGNIDGVDGDELAIGVYQPSVTTYVRVIPGGEASP